jgi:spermidine synthase
MKNTIRLSISLIGFTAMAAQIIYMRQLLIVFYGNELSISFILASWLIAGAVGSALLGRFADTIKYRITAFALCQIILSIFLPLGIIAARLIKSAINVNPGQILPIFPIMFLSFFILAPICVILGFMFSLGCRICGLSSDESAIKIGNVYILEAAGSLIGGAITSIILIKMFDAFNIALFLSGLNIIAAFFLIVFSKEIRIRILPAGGILVLLAALLLMGPMGWIQNVSEYSLVRQWRGYDLVASKDSIYGNIAVVKKGENFSFFDNGLRLYTIPDRLNSEEATHLTLLEHPGPHNILLIGGGTGLVEEILKEPVKRIDYVEMDPLVIFMAKNYLPDSYYNALKDEKVSIKNVDGRFYVKNAKEKYDCVILHVGDPYTANINRYYTAEFFKEVKKILKKGGILSVGLTSSESYISPALGEFLRSIYFTLKDVFDDCLVMPGDTAYFMASVNKGYLTYDYNILEERTKKRMLDTKYVREYYLFSKLSPGNISYARSVIENKKGIRINHDFKPAAYYYGLIFWTTLFRDSFISKILMYINERLIWQTLGIFIILLTMTLAFFRRSFKKTVLIALAAGGFSTMAFQILILLTFQTMYGYLFYKLGIILTAFMAGLTIGAIFGVRIIERLGRERAFLLAVQGDFLLFSVILPVFFLKFGLNFLFPVMSIIVGFIGGSQFTLASKVLASKGQDAGRVGGLTYGVDLLGSFLGALLAGIFLIPILGIPKTCVALAVINMAVLGLLAFNVSIEE